MPTTVHIPAPLLERVDARAKTLGISRNRLVIEALEEKLTAQTNWPPELVRVLTTPVEPDVAAAADEMLEAIRAGRRSRKRPAKL